MAESTAGNRIHFDVEEDRGLLRVCKVLPDERVGEFIATPLGRREVPDRVGRVRRCSGEELVPFGRGPVEDRTPIQQGEAGFVARHERKALGGGMRQAGILAAAGIVSLESMVDRLVEDHRHARLLANGLASIPGIKLDLDLVKTNIVFFDLDEDSPFTAHEVAQKMREQANIWVGTAGPRRFRAVTHYWIGQNDIKSFLNLMEQILQD